MRSKFVGYALAVGLGLGSPGSAFAQPKTKGKATEVGTDKTIDKQLEWEKKVMGDDGGKAADMRKINAAQKLADEAARRPPPIQAPKVKDPNKEGVRAKQEAAIGLPIASDQEIRAAKKSGGNGGKKTAAAQSSANDELGALIASSLAEEKSTEIRSAHGKRAAGGPASRGKSRAKAAPAPSSLDQMFANSK